MSLDSLTHLGVGGRAAQGLVHLWWTCRGAKNAGAVQVGNHLQKTHVVIAVDHIRPAPNLQSIKLPNKLGTKKLASNKGKDFCASCDLLRGSQAAIPCYL